MGLQLFRKHLEGARELQAKMVSGLLALVHKERQGDMVQRELIRNLLRMLWHLQVNDPLPQSLSLLPSSVCSGISR